MLYARNRLFLAILIIAAKYLNDSAPRNKHWAVYGVYFSVTELNNIERQVLFLLDYDLRFNEFEMCMAIAPFANSLIVAAARQHKTRAAAVEVVSKASRVRARAQMPPTPPPDTSLPPLYSTASTVHGLTETLSSTHLSMSTSTSTSSSCSSLPMQSSISNDSNVSATDSEMGSLVDDSGSSSSEMSSSEDEAETGVSRKEESTGIKKFTLRPVSAHAYRQGRKPSDTSSVRSTATVRASGFEKVTTSQRSSTYYTQVRGQHASNIPASTNLLSFSRINGSTSSFLSRMWGAAKGQPDKDACNKTGLAPPVVDVVEPGDNVGGGAFRRLVHTRSAFFHHGPQVLDV
jgi:G1/S-specific cyclin PLC1